MGIEQANINNLTALWEQYGAHVQTISKRMQIRINTHWPFRSWCDWEQFARSQSALDSIVFNNGLNTELNKEPNAVLQGWLNILPAHAIVPIWQIQNSSASEEYFFKALKKLLVQKGWRIGFKQTAMFLTLNEAPKSYRSRLEIQQVKSQELLKSWVHIVSEAFSYQVDTRAIAPLILESNTRVVLAFQDDIPVAAALLYKTGKIIGIHQVGVGQAVQGQGLATQLMHQLLQMCWEWEGSHVVLQASEQGKKLYLNLGFQEQFVIENYSRTTEP